MKRIDTIIYPVMVLCCLFLITLAAMGWRMSTLDEIVTLTTSLLLVFTAWGWRYQAMRYKKRGSS